MKKNIQEMLVKPKWILFLALLLSLFLYQVFSKGTFANVTHASGGGPVFLVMNTSETLPDGVWFRNSPHTADTDRVTGHGVYAGDSVQLICYAFGDAVGAYNNRLWYDVTNVTRPTVPGTNKPNEGYLNAHYINDGEAANQIDTGVPACGPVQPPPPSTPVPSPKFYELPSSNWGGYAASQKQFTDVKATWKVTPVTCSKKEAHEYTWIGLGGVDTSLEQIGTAADCWNGKPLYRAWWQFVPQFSEIQPINFVPAGATITAEVQYRGNGIYYLSITANNRVLFAKNLHGKMSANNPTADFIVERPGALLSQYQPITFSNCSANNQSIASAPGEIHFTLINNMKQKLPLEKTSSLNGANNSFTVTWLGGS